MLPKNSLRAWPMVVAIAIALGTAMWGGLVTGAGGDALKEAEDLLKKNQPAEAEQAGRRALLEATTAYGADSLEAARAMDRLVEALYRGGHSHEPETKELGSRALAIKERLAPSSSREIAYSVGNLLFICRINGDYRELPALYMRGRGLWLSDLGPDASWSAKTLANFCLELGHANRMDLALEACNGSIRIQEAAGDPAPKQLARTLNARGTVYAGLFDYEHARADLERACALSATLPGPEARSATAHCHNNLANTESDFGDIVAAKRDYDVAIHIWESEAPDSVLLAKALSNSALLVEELGETTEARYRLHRAIEIQASEDPYHPDLATYLIEMAQLLGRGKDFTTAEPLARRALDIREKKLDPSGPEVLEVLETLADLERQTGRTTDARTLLERVLRAREQRDDAGPFLARTLLQLARLNLADGRLADARSQQSRAIESLQALFGPLHPEVTSAREELAKTQLMMNELSAATAISREAESAGRTRLRTITRSLPEDMAVRYASVRAGGLDVLLTIAARRAKGGNSIGYEAWDEVVRSRAVVLDEMMLRTRRYAENPEPELEGLWKEFASSRERLARILVRDVGQVDVDQYRNALNEARNREEELGRMLSLRSRVKSEEEKRDALGLDTLLAGLRKGSGLLSYVRYESADEPHESRYIAFLTVAGSKRVSVFPLGAAKRIDEAVESWLESLRPGPLEPTKTDESTCRERGRRVRASIWDPLASSLGNLHDLHIVPDGSLALINFGALPTATNSYLIEEDPLLHYLSTERDLMTRARRTEAPKGLLAIGGPAYESSPKSDQATKSRAAKRHADCESFRSRVFDDLPQARREALEIVELWRQWSTTPTSKAHPVSSGSATLVVGEDATESRFKTEAPKHRFVQVATHGFSISGACSPDAARGDSPLLLSGLVFAGANHRDSVTATEDDGVLTTEEIASLDLTGTTWAVLSACGSGVGDVRNGEGVFGLRRAFQVAGVRSVITSLWDVEDNATRRWMKELYRVRLSKASTTTRAATMASRTLLDDARHRGLSTHPTSWAGFIALVQDDE